jgi:hypothetical protein
MSKKYNRYCEALINLVVNAAANDPSDLSLTLAEFSHDQIA